MCQGIGRVGRAVQEGVQGASVCILHHQQVHGTVSVSPKQLDDVLVAGARQLLDLILHGCQLLVNTQHFYLVNQYTLQYFEYINNTFIL